MRYASHPRSEPNYHQTSLRLDNETYELLAAAAKAHGLTIAEEMRRRLFASLTSMPPREGDKPTQRLIDAANGMAASLADWVGPWYSAPGPCEAFAAALVRWLRGEAPKGDPVLHPTPSAREFFGRRPITPGSIAAMLVALHSIPDEPCDEDKG
jgi:hypothetical protein